MADSLVDQWQAAFLGAVQRYEQASALREAALKEKLVDWTRELTAVSVTACHTVGWQASAKGHRLDVLPVPRSEYLALDVMAFAGGDRRWRFPVAIMELENSTAVDRIAYSLWKVLCVRADLRVVFCYRRTAQEGSELVRFLRDDVVQAMDVNWRSETHGDTLVVVGHRNDSATFPYGFFKWWLLDKNIGSFRLL